jgi:PEP-CTERM motif
MLRTARIQLVLFGLLVVAVQNVAADVYVLREGDGTGFGPSGAGTDAAPVFIDHFTDAGVVVGSAIALPTTAGSGATPNALTLGPTSTSMGHLSLSTDGQYLVLIGYSSEAGTGLVRATAAATTPRTIGRIKLSNGAIDTTTALTDAYTGGSSTDPRNVVSDGTSFWAFGTGSSSTAAGPRYVAALGDTTSTQVSSAPTNVRIGRIVSGQLYESSASGSFVGISTVGSGLPTTGGQTTTISVTTGTNSTSSSPYDFWFKDPYTVYIADDRAKSDSNGVSGGGIQKWVANVAGDYNGNHIVDAADYVLWRDQEGTSPATPGTGADGDGSGTVDSLDYDFWRDKFGNNTPTSWSFAYVLNGSSTDEGVRGLDGTVNGNGDAVLFATTNTAGFTAAQQLAQTSLVTVTDTGAGSTFSTLSTSAADTFYRGVVYIPTIADGAGLATATVPEPASAVLLLFGIATLAWRRR